MTGYRRSELVGRHVEVLVPPRLRRQHVNHRRRFYARGAARLMGAPGSDLTLRRKDGSVVMVEISLGPAGGDTVAVIRDSTQRRSMEQALEHRALHDPLTDLANRTLFFDRLEQSIRGARRESKQVALVMLDLDGFKAINDAFGHAVGDEVLRKLGSRLRAGLRASDTAARIGGDEFRAHPSQRLEPPRGGADGAQKACRRAGARAGRQGGDQPARLGRDRDVPGRRPRHGHPDAPLGRRHVLGQARGQDRRVSSCATQALD